MQIIKLNEDKKLNNSVVVLGNFDGIHKGHQELIKKAREIKDKKGGNIVFFTFYPHPLEIITGKKSSQLIFSRAEKIATAEELGVDIYFEYSFNDFSSKISADEFIKDILVGKLGAKAIVIGEDFRFAYKREGSARLLSSLKNDYGYEVYAMKKLEKDGEIISSTLLRECIFKLDFARFRDLAGRNYFILGEVLHGKAIGRTLGYPTANLKIDERKLELKKGVYATRTIIGDRAYDSISFVGNSLGDKARGQFETYIFDFADDIYGDIIKVEILAFIRGQKEVKSLEHLKEMIEDDIKKVKEIK